MTHRALSLPWRSGARGRWLHTLAGAVLVTALIWLSMAYHLEQRRERDVAEARRDVANMSVALAEQVLRLVESADQALRLMQEDYARDPAGFDLVAWIRRSSSLHAVANQVAVFDERGDLVVSEPSSSARARVNIADRPMFAALSTEPDAGLFIGRTYVSRIQRGMVFPLGRRLVDGSGVFRGLVTVSVDPARLAKEFKALDVGAAGSIALFGLDGYLRVRAPAVDGMYDRDLRSTGAPHGIFEKLDQVPVGIYETNSPFDDTRRLFAYRKIDGLPLAIAVGRSRDEVLAPFRSEVVRVGAYGAVATAIVALLLALLLREQGRRAVDHAALSEAEASLRGVFESSPDILSVVRVAADGVVTLELMNTAMLAARSIGEDYRGRRMEEVIPSQAFARASRSIAAVVATGQSLRVQAHAFDDERDCEVILVPLSFAATGRPTRIFISIRDVSHLRRAETAIAASEARYRLLAGATTDMITHMDLTGRRLFVSPAANELLGYPAGDLVGTSPHQMIHPDDAARLKAIFADLAAGRIDRIVNVNRLRHRDGRWIWIEAALRLLRDDQGRPSSVVGVMRDITERRRAEAALVASETRFRLLAENSNELVMLGTDKGAASYVSPASLPVLGYTPAELLALPHPREWVHPDDLPRMGDAGLRSASTSEGVLLRLRRKDGSWMWAEAMFGRIPDAREGEPSIVASFRDVSERQAQAEALRQAKEAAEQASRAKTDFLATMSHEIRTPLHAVLGYADLLLADKGIAGERRLGLERIQNAGSALRTVVDDILNFSKIEAGEVDLVPHLLRIGPLVEDAVSIVRGSARQKALALVVELGAGLPGVVIGDRDRLRQILLNLLNNAVKFTPAGSVTLSVHRSSLRERDGPDVVRLRFAVADTGIGIAAEKTDRLFRRFSQVDGSISREFGGTGLGLAICKRLVEAMGGEVGVSSAFGNGSTFWFELPFAVAVSAAQSGPTPAAPPRCPPRRVLLVDDQELNRQLARAVLEAAGHVVDAAADGAAAVAAVTAASYDVVLLDMQMPVMGGLEAAQRIRGLSHPACSVSIIAMTANVLPAQVDEIRAAGMDGHVGKPFRQDELLAAVAGSSATAAAAAPRDARPDAPALDAATLDELAAVIGFGAADRILCEALTEVAALDAGVGRDALAARARVLLPSLGMFGLRGLASRLSALEQACCRNGAVEPALIAVGEALAQARDEVATVRASRQGETGAAAA